MVTFACARRYATLLLYRNDNVARVGKPGSSGAKYALKTEAPQDSLSEVYAGPLKGGMKPHFALNRTRRTNGSSRIELLEE
jgi:hypothetical protein